MAPLLRLGTIALVVAVLGVTLSSCGTSGDEDKVSSLRQAQQARQQQFLEDRKLTRLRRELKAERARAAEERKAVKASDAPQPSPSQPAGFAEFAESLPGQVGVAIGPPGAPAAAVAGDLTTGAAWSTSKVPVALRVLKEAGGPPGLSAAQQGEIRAALTLSDNAAALSLFADLEAAHGGAAGAAAAVDEVLAEAGDGTTNVSSEGRDGFTPFGQTEWSLALQEQFMAALAAGCIGEQGSAEYVLGLMGEVSSDTWGLGSAGLPARWKGGWGPGLDGHYLARQMGILELEGEQAVVALAALPDDGSFETAQSMATSLAQWLAAQASAYAGSPTAGCSL